MEPLARLRAQAIAQTLFAPGSLRRAIERLGFVQADPIRAPARAQDLILRHRVTGYRAGQLERDYGDLDLEEGVLYAYGFLPRSTASLLHRRRTARLSKLERAIWSTVDELGHVHPRQLDARFGRERVVNAWGGYSQATKRALEQLHHRGLLRIAGRANGVRIYAAAPEAVEARSPDERFRALVLVVAGLLAPVPEATLHSVLARLKRRVGGRAEHREVVRALLQSGELEATDSDAGRYLAPPARRAPVEESPRVVRFLAPFDPVVWDRRRFEHLWNWRYRFEAYTPVKKRIRGYYAMPLAWGADVIGWANLAAGPTLDVELGFVSRRPRDPGFRRELDAEVARTEAFLGL